MYLKENFTTMNTYLVVGLVLVSVLMSVPTEADVNCADFDKPIRNNHYLINDTDESFEENADNMMYCGAPLEDDPEDGGTKCQCSKEAPTATRSLDTPEVCPIIISTAKCQLLSISKCSKTIGQGWFVFFFKCPGPPVYFIMVWKQCCCEHYPPHPEAGCITDSRGLSCTDVWIKDTYPKSCEF